MNIICKFKNTILAHKGGFLLSSGDCDGDRSSSVDFNSVFFDSAEMLGENWLTFKNKLDEKVIDGKKIGSIYSIGSTSINMKDLEAIDEHDGNYLIDSFDFRVSRMFTLQFEDEFGFGSWLCIGLL